MAELTQTNTIDKTKGWIEKMTEKIKEMFSFNPRKPLAQLPAVLLLCESLDRPGISAIALTGAVIKRLSEAGIPTGPNPDGTENLTNRFVQIMCEEIVNELKLNAKISVAIPTGSIQVVGTIDGPTGVVTATNIVPVTGTGISQ